MVMLAGVSFAQSTIEGTIIDSDQEPIIGAVIAIDGINVTTTDFDGNFSTSVKPGERTLKVSSLGKKDYTKTITLAAGETFSIQEVLSAASEELETIVVTGSGTKTNIKNEISSIAVVTKEQLLENGSTDLSKAITRVPGVQMIDGQATIRSGSGYAYGAGSRVMVMVDQQPMLSAELSDVKWNFIPIENAASVEILKGASSVLYGSAALDGVINVISAWPEDKPYTSISIYNGLYGAPRTASKKWWGTDDRKPMTTGLYFAHRERIKENVDLVVGGNIHADVSPIFQADEYRARFNINTRFRSKKKEGTAFGLNTNVMYYEIGNFFLWQDGYDNAYKHIGNIGRDRYYAVSVDPFYLTFDKFGNQHTARSRIYTITKVRSDNAPTLLLSGQYQFQREMKKDLTLTAGLNTQYFFAQSPVFGEADTLGTLNAFDGGNGALFAQVNKSMVGGKLNTTLGVRWEGFIIGPERSANLPVFRAGLNYEFSPFDHVRASFGQGFRVPGLGERFIDAEITDGVNVLPNPNLKPESGYNIELGYRRDIKVKKTSAHADIALFWMQYKDMTEFYFDWYLPDSINREDIGLGELEFYLRNYLGFKSVNVSQARIAGFEVSGQVNTMIGKTPITIWGGYTYTYPGDLVADSTQINVGTYLSNAVSTFFNGVDRNNTEQILKYRSLHTARVDAEVGIIPEKFSVGMSANYNSFFHSVDPVLIGTDPFSPLIDAILGGRIVTEDNRGDINGDWLFDARAAYKFKGKHSLELTINNLFNREYPIRPAKMAPTRRIMLTANLVF